MREVGVEEEFLIFAADRPALADAGPRVVATAARLAADDDAQFEKELKQAQAELATAPTTDLADLAGSLRARRRELAAAARERGLRPVASATCPVPEATDTTDKPRYRAMAQQFAALADEQLTCAMHVHVSVGSDDEGARVLGRIAPWLALLTALSANSPYRDGQDSGYASLRKIIWGQWPTSGPTAPFADGADYRRSVERLVATGAARDDGMIYFDARLSAHYPTVEIRVCDVVPTVQDAVTLAGLCRALVATAASDDTAPLVRPELLRAADWRAARYGMSGELADLRHRTEPGRLVPAWELVAGLLDYVAPQLDATGDGELVRSGVGRIRELGTGADRQRAAARSGDLAAAIDAVTVAET